LRSVSYDFGAPKAGTPKADEWRTLITIYIPLALISLWGDGMAHKSKNIDRAIAYRSFVSTWVSQLKILHPAVDHHPNCHMSIPIYKFLLSFGLVRSWWCFPFEHLIGQLQHLPTNNKFSQLESTILTSYVQAAKLKAWLARDNCPPAIKECQIVTTP
ncbi:hypothetical protein SCLCIDRAFT_115334, partial [Scleroderma citrinum Foug A]